MSVGYVGKVPNTRHDIVAQQALAEREAQWGEIPGRIIDFDAQTQTATIQPLYKPRVFGKPIDMPELLEVPVRFQRAGNGAVTFPVKAGDMVTLRPQMRSSENYHVDDDGTASDARSLNLSDMEAFLDGGESLTDPISNFDNENMHVRFDPDGQHGIRGSADGKIKIEGSEGNIFDFLVQNVEKTAEGFTLLGTEPDLVHRVQYAEIGEDLTELAEKLRAMAL